MAGAIASEIAPVQSWSIARSVSVLRIALPAPLLDLCSAVSTVGQVVCTVSLSLLISAELGFPHWPTRGLDVIGWSSRDARTTCYVPSCTPCRPFISYLSSVHYCSAYRIALARPQMVSFNQTRPQRSLRSNPR